VQHARLPHAAGAVADRGASQRVTHHHATRHRTTQQRGQRDEGERREAAEGAFSFFRNVPSRHFFFSLSALSHRSIITCSANAPVVQAIHSCTDMGDRKQATYNLFAAYLHTVPLEELIASVERARRDAKLRYVVIYGVAYSYCLVRAERLDGSYLRTFALELKEQLA
jgi:hypothetical protein